MNQIEKENLILLARQYNSIQKASTELINLSAILNLPKGMSVPIILQCWHFLWEGFRCQQDTLTSIKRKVPIAG